MKKTKKDLLASFMKRNKEAREKMAINAGFDNASKFKAHLLRGIKREEGKVSKEEESIKEIETSVDLGSESLEVQSKLDMVIAFDTTGSMRSYIEDVRKRAVEIATNLFKNTTDLRISVVAFGDYCDIEIRGEDKFGKAYQVLPLTNNVKDIVKFIQSARNTGGGDSDEFYELVIQKVTNETQWRADAKKAVLLIGDAEPHKVGYSCRHFVQNSQIDWKVEANKSADLGIQWDTFTIHSSTAHFYKKLSEITGGVSLPFSSAENTSDVIEGLAYKRAGSTSAYSSKVATATASGDIELIGTFKTISTLD